MSAWVRSIVSSILTNAAGIGNPDSAPVVDRLHGSYISINQGLGCFDCVNQNSRHPKSIVSLLPNVPVAMKVAVAVV